MSRIDDLIQQHCPSGVEYRALGEVAAYSSDRVAAALVDSDSFVGVDNLLANKRGKKRATYLPNAPVLTAYSRGDVLLGNIRPYLKKVWLADHHGGCSGDVLAVRLSNGFKERLVDRFLFYVLSSDGFFAYSNQNAKGAKMPRGSKDAILRYRIPVPPIEVQSEIVRVLDLFQSLEVKLEAELEGRRRQYALVRSALLKFAPDDVIETTLGEVCRTVSSGGTPLSTREEYYGGDIPWLRTQEVRYADIVDTEVKITDAALKNSAARWVPANSVIVAISGAGVTRGRVAVNRIPLTTNQHCCALQIDPKKAHYRYVFHWLGMHYDGLRSRGQGNRSDLNMGIVKGYPITLPSLEEQERIASVLDKFDALVNDLSVGLPAELAARRKQYEYYRDRLLTFKEAA